MLRKFKSNLYLLVNVVSIDPLNIQCNFSNLEAFQNYALSISSDVYAGRIGCNNVEWARSAHVCGFGFLFFLPLCAAE